MLEAHLLVSWERYRDGLLVSRAESRVNVELAVLKGNLGLVQPHVSALYKNKSKTRCMRQATLRSAFLLSLAPLANVNLR